MAGSPPPTKDQSFTFRLEPALEAALTASAEQQHKQPAQLLRELVQAHVAQRERQTFEAEARRQCLAINERARDPNSDEAQIMRELEAHLQEMARNWP